MVLASLGDFKVAHEESFRFEALIKILQVNETGDAETSSPSGGRSDEDGIWDARTACMALINAITNCPESLEDRIMLRDELTRRGLNEVIVVCYVK